MRWPQLQARVAAATEIARGLLFAVGLLTPFAAAGMIGRDGRRRHGAPTAGTGSSSSARARAGSTSASIAVAAWCVAAIGPGEASLDHAIGLDWTAWDGWIGAVIAGVLGVGGGDPPARRLLPPAAA